MGVGLGNTSFIFGNVANFDNRIEHGYYFPTAMLWSKFITRGGGGGAVAGYSGYIWVGMCRWDSDTLTLY